MAESVPGKITMKFSSETPLWRRERLFRDIQATELVSHGADDSYVLAVPEGSESAACVRLNESAFVVYAEPVYIDRVMIPKAP